MQTLKRASTVNTDLPIKLPLARDVVYVNRRDMWQEGAENGIPYESTIIRCLSEL